MIGGAERFFRDSDYWKSWSAVPDQTSLSHRAHRRLHRALGRFVPQPILRTFGQSLFVYGWRK